MSQKLSEVMASILMILSQEKVVTKDILHQLLILDLNAEPVFESLQDLKKGSVLHLYRNYLIDTARSLQFTYNKTKDPSVSLKMEAILTTKSYRHKKKTNVATMYPSDVKVGASHIFLNRLIETALGKEIPEDAPSGDTEVRLVKDIFKGVSDEEAEHILTCKQSDSVILTTLKEECFDSRGIFIGGRGYRALESPIGTMFQNYNTRLTMDLWNDCKRRPWFK